ncbi:E3 ubiquitin-protein ligase SIAH2 [Protobothrops mucrosquamatus]|uniref:E3 ubiquitin-protein ligase SIAH2 n=1 Tax=Protobothrops mucrosquamatus TaxID=103944 RepID=UPI0007758B6E|nr:E3 ubiquitin-protein ligase SIAH2 [Protobothrops mucrosquamatus]
MKYVCGNLASKNKNLSTEGVLLILQVFYKSKIMLNLMLETTGETRVEIRVVSTFQPKNVNNEVYNSLYATTGCSLTLHHTEKPDHEDICEYRPYSCPCPGASCKWQGSLEAVMSHLMHAHKSITTLQGEDIVFLATDINLPGAVDWVMMQSCFGHHFMLVLEKQEKYEGHQQFFAIVLLIGTRKQAENFAYRLELNGNRRRLTWEATPRSIHDGVAAAIMNSDCLVFDTAIAHLFADNGNLGINVTISTCCP